jgi:iron complex outermembrane receptor protein
MQKYLGSAVGAAILMALAAPALAQDLRVNVPVGQGGSLTAPTTSMAEESLRKIPGGADVVPAKEFQDGYALSMKDMLNTTPGVLAQPRWGEESRLSIRGSGLSRGYHMRGITLLQDGIPLTFADGGSDFQEIDPLTLQHVEI